MTHGKSLLLMFAGLAAAVVVVVGVAAAINGDDRDATRDAVAEGDGDGDGGGNVLGICIEGAVDCVDTPLENPDEPVSNDNGGEDLASGETAAVALALADLSERTGEGLETIVLVSTEPITWGNACLGIEDPDLVCAEVITPGFIVTLEHSGATYVYHTDEGKTALLAE